MPLDAFKYSPLNAASNEIRLVQLLSGVSTENDGATAAEPLLLEVRHFTLEACPPFVALSYTWGDPDDNLPVILNGHSILITRHLASFLHQAHRRRRRTGSIWGQNDRESGDDAENEYLWIDALCIDQSNIPERNAQVDLMRILYQSAKTVAVWLGPEADNSTLAVETIKVIASHVHSALRRKGISWGSRTIGHVVLSRLLDTNCWMALRAISSRPWWKRAWVLQEASACAIGQPIAYCGDKSFILDDLGTVFRAISMHIVLDPKILEPVIGESRGARELFRVKWDRQSANADPRGRFWDTYTLLDNIRNREASDPRDRIYSVLALASDREAIDMHANYSLKLSEVHIEAAVRVIQVSKSLDVLNSSGCGLHGQIPGLPTWVPDWSPGNFSYYITSKHRNFGIKYFNSSGNAPLAVSFSHHNSRLHVSGIGFDTISAVATPRPTRDYPPREQEGDEQQHEADIEATLQDWKAMASSARQEYPSGGITIAAFQYLLCADLSRHGKDRGCMIPLEDVDNGVAFGKHSMVKRATRSRRMVWTSRGYIGLTQKEAEVGDRVCVLFGGQTPFVLRKVGEHWILVGDCYVHGIMDGQAVRDLLERGEDATTFEIW